MERQNRIRVSRSGCATLRHGSVVSRYGRGLVASVSPAPPVFIALMRRGGMTRRVGIAARTAASTPAVNIVSAVTQIRLIS